MEMKVQGLKSPEAVLLQLLLTLAETCEKTFCESSERPVYLGPET
jgi:hypothetical protein